MSGNCQSGSVVYCYCDANCYLFKDCCSDVPSDCEERGIISLLYLLGFAIIINYYYILRVHRIHYDYKQKLYSPN